ncbi:MAG: chemotaxis protein [Oscillospiraceae bacterium]|jgi:two-component system chemotaxis response regulator CheV|nr:chemotaxis protein [Oscillospiraceae bacterium]
MAKKASSTSEILLESGTNELEIMEFTIAGNIFGINVAKLNNIMKYEPVKPMPNSHPHVEGIFKPRDKIITVIDLPSYMGLPPTESTERNYFIITNFNKMEVAFHVHTVEAIHRISWDNIEKPDKTIYGGVEGLATGIAKVKDKLITIVDFEKIVFDISPESGIRVEEIKELGPRERSLKPVFIAEDSQLLQRLILDSIHEAGYENVTTFANGQEAWDRLTELRKSVLEEGRPLESMCCVLITDIEMPRMDGHRLTKLVKDDSTLKRIPVIIFSSLIDEAMRVKGESLGANAQLSKPEIGNLVATLDQWIL